MSNLVVRKTVKDLLTGDTDQSISIKNRFNEILGKKSTGFMSSIINISNTPTLKDCNPMSIISSAVVAATLDLPVDPNIAFSYVVPYNCKNKKTGQWEKKAQFQLGYRGYVQLALRTSQYKNINVVEIFEGQLKNWNPLTEELEFDFNYKESDKVIGYAGFFKLINGFQKTVYWTKEEVLNHAKKYSKSIEKGPWKDNFNGMAKKTVLKNMLKKWGILSIEMQTAVKADQGVIKEDIINGSNINNCIEYVDSPSTTDIEAEVKEEIRENSNKEIIDISKDIIDAKVIEDEEDVPY